MNHKGFSLVELLIAMAISLVILSGVVSVMLDSKNAYRFEEETAYMQENARFLLDQLGYDLNMAGHFGCAYGPSTQIETIANELNTTGDWPNRSALAVRGFTEGDAGIPAAAYPDIKTDTDVIILNHGVPIDGLLLESHSPISRTLTFRAPVGYTGEAKVGEALRVVAAVDANCEQVVVFRQRVDNDLSIKYTPGRLFRAKDDTGAPYGPQRVLATNSELYELVSHGYYVRDESAVTGQPSLVRVSLSSTGGTTTQELVSGVDDVQILYGVPVGNTWQYFDSAALGTNEDNWKDVKSVRMNIVLRSAFPVFPRNTAVDLGDGFTYNDQYMRQLVSFSGSLRN